MNDNFKEAILALKDNDCERCATAAIKMLAALSQAIDECANDKTVNLIQARFLDLIGR